MNLQTLTDRLQGAISACLVEEGLIFCAINTIYFSSNKSYFLGIMVIQMLLGVWLFFDRRITIFLAIVYKAFLVRELLRFILASHVLLTSPAINQKISIAWSFAALEGVQIIVLLTITSLKYRLAAYSRERE